MNKIILDLCAGTGAWSRPYVEAGYDVRLVTWPGRDVREYRAPSNIHGILAAPPCTMFSLSGNRWKRTTEQMIEALQVADACLRIKEECSPEWWALENPAGILSRVIGQPKIKFQPYEFGDPYQKETWIWGEFSVPVKIEYTGPVDQRIFRKAPSKDRVEKRSITPGGFAQAFFEANP
jgi:site-specific DNA-cytosine methylase